MKNVSIALGVYFEIRDAKLYGGAGTVGYAAVVNKFRIEELEQFDFGKYAEDRRREWARLTNVPQENVRIIPADEYERNTGGIQ